MTLLQKIRLFTAPPEAREYALVQTNHALVEALAPTVTEKHFLEATVAFQTQRLNALLGELNTARAENAMMKGAHINGVPIGTA